MAGRPKGYPKTGGRRGGTPNKRTSESANAFAHLAGTYGEKYAQILDDIAQAKEQKPDIRLLALRIAAPYIWRKQPEAHEISGPDGGGIPVIVHKHLTEPPK